MKIKLKDVANMAGVSLTTASLVFSKTGRISDETRDKVLRAADHLGYSRKKKKPDDNTSATVGILYNIDPEWAFILFFIQPVIAELEKELTQKNLHTVLVPISNSSSNEEIIKKLEHIGCKAVVSLHYGNERLMGYLENSGIPVIVVMNSNFQNKFYTVCVDDYQGAYEGTIFLLDLGHKNILFMDFLRPDLPHLSSDRFVGFKKALDERNTDFPDNYMIVYNQGDQDRCKEQLSELFNGSNKPTALFCLDDDVAGRAISALNEMEFSVPEDVSVIAPGDVLNYSMPYTPRITTMRIDTTYLGRIAAQMVINRLEHNPEDVHVLKIKQQLHSRGSCRKIG